MDFAKYQLTKKWWQSTKYAVHDSKGQLIYTTFTKGFFTKKIIIYSHLSGEELVFKQASTMSFSLFDIIKNNQKVGYLKKALLKTKFEIYINGLNPIFVNSKNWGKNLLFVVGEKEIGIMSKPLSSWNKLGLVVSEEYDPAILIGVIVVLRYVKSSGNA